MFPDDLLCLNSETFRRKRSGTATVPMTVYIRINVSKLISFLIIQLSNLFYCYIFPMKYILLGKPSMIAQYAVLLLILEQTFRDVIIRKKGIDKSFNHSFIFEIFTGSITGTTSWRTYKNEVPIQCLKAIHTFWPVPRADCLRVFENNTQHYQTSGWLYVVVKLTEYIGLLFFKSLFSNLKYYQIKDY